MEIYSPTKTELNSFVEANQGSLQQSWQWGELQERMQRAVQRFFFTENDRPIASASFIKHDLPFGKCYWLCPKGPVLKKESGIMNQELWSRIGKELQGIFIRIEPELPPTFTFQLSTSNFQKAPKDHNPRATILLDLNKSEEDLLAHMHSKTRYNLRLSQKKNIQIREQKQGKDVEDFYKMLQITAKRDNFYLHPKSYYQALAQMPEIRIFLAYHSEKVIASAMVSFFAGQATYLHGGSDYDYRQLMAPYLLHWEILRIAKRQGIRKYDLGGIAPKSETNHQFAGFTRFKEGLGGSYQEFLGSYDLVLNSFWYGIYKLGRRML